jgi:Arm domain-containing DNA-binding protein
MALTDGDDQKGEAKREGLQDQRRRLNVSLGHLGRRQALVMGLRLDGKEKLMSFGRYPDVSLAMARERHSEARRLLAGGIDPMVQRKTERTGK